MNATAALLAALGLVALITVGLIAVARQPVFAVKSIRLVGDLNHNSVLTIRANALPHLSGNFFTLDLAAARRAFEAVPWVRRALVRRVWPNQLSVQLEEYRPVALWATPGSNDEVADRLVDNHGEVFEANLGDVEDDALPTLRGPEGSAASMLRLLGRLQPVFAPLEARVETLELSPRGSWRVELDTGARLELGAGSEAEVVDRTGRFVATVASVTHQYKRPVEYADLRHNDGYAVRLRGVSTALTAASAAPVGKPAKR